MSGSCPPSSNVIVEESVVLSRFFTLLSIAAASAALVLSGCAHFTKEQIAEANAKRDQAIKEHDIVYEWVKKHEGKSFSNEDRTKYIQIARSCWGGGGAHTKLPFEDRNGNTVYKHGTKWDTADGKKTLPEIFSSCADLSYKLENMEGGKGCYSTLMSVISYQDGQSEITSPTASRRWAQVTSAKNLSFNPTDCEKMPKASEPIPAVLKSYASDLKEFCPHVMKFRAQRWTNDVDKSSFPHRPYKYLEVLCYKKT
jgi:hypothetical protein